jgi:hypothetical protein
VPVVCRYSCQTEGAALLSKAQALWVERQMYMLAMNPTKVIARPKRTSRFRNAVYNFITSRIFEVRPAQWPREPQSCVRRCVTLPCRRSFRAQILIIILIIIDVGMLAAHHQGEDRNFVYITDQFNVAMTIIYTIGGC